VLPQTENADEPEDGPTDESALSGLGEVVVQIHRVRVNNRSDKPYPKIAPRTERVIGMKKKECKISHFVKFALISSI